MMYDKITPRLVNAKKTVLREFGISDEIIEKLFRHHEFNSLRGLDTFAENVLRRYMNDELNEQFINQVQEHNTKIFRKGDFRMKDFENKVFTTESEMLSFFKTQESTDNWISVFTSELEALPLEDNELLLHMNNGFKTELRNGVEVKGFAKGVSDDDITTSMTTTKMALALPVNNKYEMYPVRYTAFDHIQERAGITGRTINSLRDKARSKEMSPLTRCMCLNAGLVLYKDRSNVLIRDGKITGIMSGDETDYSIMPVSRLLNIIETELNSFYKSYAWRSARTSHEMTEVIYDIGDKDLEKRILNLLSSYGMLVSEVKVQLLFTTSDVGKSAARLTPIITADGRIIPFGKSLFVEHKGGEKAMALFCDIAHAFLAKYRENAENLKRLMNITVHSPAACLYNIYSKGLKMSGYGTVLKECMERIETEHQNTCTGYDIYFYLCEMLFLKEELDKQRGREISIFQSSKAQETVASVLFMDIASFDE